MWNTWKIVYLIICVQLIQQERKWKGVNKMISFFFLWNAEVWKRPRLYHIRRWCNSSSTRTIRFDAQLIGLWFPVSTNKHPPFIPSHRRISRVSACRSLSLLSSSRNSPLRPGSPFFQIHADIRRRCRRQPESFALRLYAMLQTVAEASFFFFIPEA